MRRVVSYRSLFRLEKSLVVRFGHHLFALRLRIRSIVDHRGIVGPVPYPQFGEDFVLLFVGKRLPILNRLYIQTAEIDGVFELYELGQVAGLRHKSLAVHFEFSDVERVRCQDPQFDEPNQLEGKADIGPRL